VFVAFLASSVFASGRQQPAADLPPWLQVNQDTLKMMYGRGVTEAGRGVKLSSLSDKLRRDIGQISSRPIPGEADSYVWLIDPYVQAYEFGWRARRNDWTPEQITAANAKLADWTTHGRKCATFQVILNVVRPSPPGPLTHPTANVFRDVQVQLKVAGRRYDPEHQPGDLAFLAGHGSITTLNDKSIPVPITGVVSGPGELASGSAQVTNYFTVDRTMKYDFFQGRFTVVFDLFDADGKPRVRPNDNAISAVVITSGGNEHQAVYAWTDLMDIRAAG
jgi:hypothetical protein